MLQVTDIAAGYGFSVFVAKSKKLPSQVFGTGLNSDSQIGKLVWTGVSKMLYNFIWFQVIMLYGKIIHWNS